MSKHPRTTVIEKLRKTFKFERTPAYGGCLRNLKETEIELFEVTQKYNFLLKHLRLRDVAENDATIVLGPLVFQFGSDELIGLFDNKDYAVELAMKDMN